VRAGAGVGEQERLIRELQALLAPVVPGCRIHLFGSRACGLALPGSDFDVVALTDSQDTTHLRVRLGTWSLVAN
jgi:predicted nucleotidyltransferase